MISLSHKTNRLYVAVLPLKCGKNVIVALICASCATFFFLTTFWGHLWSITEQTPNNTEFIRSIDIKTSNFMWKVPLLWLIYSFAILRKRIREAQMLFCFFN